MSTRTAAAIVALVGAAALYGGMSRPARRDTAAAEAQIARIEAESVPLRARLAEREARHATEERLRGPQSEARPGDGASALRRILIRSLRAAPVSAVRLSVAAGGAGGARAHLSAEGSLHDIVSLSSDLTAPGGGFVPERVRWAPAGSGLLMELDGISMRGQP